LHQLFVLVYAGAAAFSPKKRQNVRKFRPICYDNFRPEGRLHTAKERRTGTALAALLAANGHAVRLWTRDAETAEQLARERENRRYLPGIPLGARVVPLSALADAVTGASVIVFAVPSSAVRGVAAGVAPFLEANAVVLSAAKGLEDETGLRVSEVLAQEIPKAEEHIVVLSGPNLAVEVARGVPTASVAAALNPDCSRRVQQLFMGQDVPSFRVYTSRDVIGVELGGAIKNVIAIGAGISDGLGFGDNSKAGLMTRGLTETIRLGLEQGAEMTTFLGLSGVGDLIATGASRLSRNYRVGFALGQGKSLPDVLAEIGQVAEGVPTTHVVCQLARISGVEMPLCEAIYAVLFNGRAPQDMIRALMLRPPKDESDLI
jgi:glycerol-3-phosphate dehydrogenase (NAD(P)+)